MKIQIISVNKRPLWQRIFTINHWRVEYEVDGVKKCGNFWADTNMESSEFLERDVLRYIEDNPKNLEGRIINL